MDIDERRREHFLTSLLINHGPELLPVLREISHRDPSYRIRHLARKHICRLHNIRRYLKLNEKSIPVALPADGDAGISRFIADNPVQSPDPLISSVAMDMISSLHITSFAPVIRDMVLNTTDPFIAARAATVLSNLQPHDTGNTLSTILRRFEDPRVRKAIAMALWTDGSPQSIRQLIRLANDKNPQIRTDAIMWLASSNWNLAGSLVTEMFHHGDDLDRLAALEVASSLALPETLAMIVTALIGSSRGLALKGHELLQKFQEARSPFAMKLCPFIEGMTPLSPDFQRIVSEALQKIGTPPVRSCGELLSSSFPADRIEGLRCSYQIAPDEARQLIFSALARENDPNLISALLTALAYHGTFGSETVSVLMNLLKHPDKRVRANAVEAARRLSPRLRQPLLAPLLTDESNRVIANSLIGFTDNWNDDCQKALDGLVFSNDRIKRFSAIFCISELGGWKNLSSLLRLCMDQDSSVNSRARETLCLLRSETEMTHGHQQAGLHFDSAFEALGIDPASSATSISIRDLAGILRESFNRYLLFSMNSSSEKDLVEVMKYVESGRDPWVMTHVRPLMNNSSPSVRYYARRAIYAIEDTLRKSLGTGKGGRRNSANESVTGKIELFTEGLNTSDPWARLETIESAPGAAVNIGAAEVVSAIAARLSREQDSAVLQNLVLFAGLLGGKGSLNLIKPFLNHPDPRVRANAVEAFGIISPEATEELHPLLNDQDNRTRANAIIAIYHKYPGEALRSLTEMIYSQEAWMKDSALFAARTIKGPMITSALLEALPRSTNLEMTVKIARTLESIGGIHQIPQLQNLLKAEKDPKRILVFRHILETIGLGSSEIDLSDLFSSSESDMLHGSIAESEVIPPAAFRMMDSIYHSLLEELNSADDIVRRRALLHIAESRDPSLFKILEIIILKDPCLSIRLLALSLRRELTFSFTGSEISVSGPGL